MHKSGWGKVAILLGIQDWFAPYTLSLVMVTDHTVYPRCRGCWLLLALPVAGTACRGGWQLLVLAVGGAAPYKGGAASYKGAGPAL